MTIEFDNIYVPSPPPQGIDRATSEWVSRELRRIHTSLRDKVGMHGEDGVWADNLANLSNARSVGGSAPTYSAVNSSSYLAPIMTTGAPTKILQAAFHINHDAKRGSRVWPHVHWTTNGTNSGSVTWTITHQIADGHNQDNFPAASTITVSETVAPAAAWRHFIAEGTDEATQSFLMPEVDALVLMTIQLTTKTIATDNVYGLYLDLHYQKERTGTINKAPNFYER